MSDEVSHIRYSRDGSILVAYSRKADASNRNEPASIGVWVKDFSKESVPFKVLGDFKTDQPDRYPSENDRRLAQDGRSASGI